MTDLRRMFGSCVLVFAQAAIVLGAQNFQDKVSLLLHEEPKNPKCFAESLRDLTCFWEEDEERAGSADQYSFTYAYSYQKQGSKKCPVRSHPAAGDKRLYICRLNQTQLFAELNILVHRDGRLLHNRTLSIDTVFLLDPPDNVTVSSTDQQGQLSVSWLPLPTYLDDLIYEVSYAPAGSHIEQLEEVKVGCDVILRGLKPGTQYKVRVRVKLNGLGYSGYWSTWTQPVFMETLPGDLDPLILALSLIISLILTILSLTAVLSRRRYVMKKIWPAIPNPESKFPGLFTVYGGDFQEWMGHTNVGLRLTPGFFYTEESPAPLEVLSEVSLSHPLPPPALPPKSNQPLASDEDKDANETDEEKRLQRVDSALMEGWKEAPHECWLMDQLQALHQHVGPHSQSSLLESHDAYVTLNPHLRSWEEPLDDIMEETLPLQVLFASQNTTLSESRSDLGSLQQSSRSGKLSSQSSFEYPNHTWPPKGQMYNYMAVADSGVSMDYSPMSSSRIDDIGKVVYAHEYKNEIPTDRRPLLVRQNPIHC